MKLCGRPTKGPLGLYDGPPCQQTLGEGREFCVWHPDPKEIREEQEDGAAALRIVSPAEQRSMLGALGGPKPMAARPRPSLFEPDACRRILEQNIEDLWTKKLSPARANAVALNVKIAVDLGRLEISEELRKLERLAAGRVRRLA
jgi:hypothetical protein